MLCHGFELGGGGIGPLDAQGEGSFTRRCIRKRRGVQKSIGNKVPWKTGMLMYLPVTSRPLIVLQKEAVLSPCNFAATRLAACILNCCHPLLKFNFEIHEIERSLSQHHSASLGCTCDLWGRDPTRRSAETWPPDDARRSGETKGPRQ